MTERMNNGVRWVWWSATGVLATFLAIAALWLVVYALQQTHSAQIEAAQKDCQAIKQENRAILSLIPQNSPYLQQVADALHGAERRVCV